MNWTRPVEDGGLFECRYVRRDDDYFIAYLSSHSGCRQACRFCHLTQTGQTTFQAARLHDLTDQLRVVLRHYDREARPAQRVNVNFMARGEPLSSHELHENFQIFGNVLRSEAVSRNLDPMINISTIFPKDAADVDLAETFKGQPVTLFWSLYSLDERFRRRWLPKAQKPEIAMERLLRWQAATGGRVVLHWALIEGENDADETFSSIADFVAASGLDARFNLVRYNPHSARTGAEAPDDRYEAALDRIGSAMKVPGSRIVPRVGFDVNASCGMFVSASGV